MRSCSDLKYSSSALARSSALNRLPPGDSSDWVESSEDEGGAARGSCFFAALFLESDESASCESVSVDFEPRLPPVGLSPLKCSMSFTDVNIL